MLNRTLQLIDALVKELNALRAVHAHSNSRAEHATNKGRATTHVANDLRRHPGSSRSEIAKRTKLDVKAVGAALQELASNGEAWYVGERRGARWVMGSKVPMSKSQPMPVITH